MASVPPEDQNELQAVSDSKTGRINFFDLVGRLGLSRGSDLKRASPLDPVGWRLSAHRLSALLAGVPARRQVVNVHGGPRQFSNGPSRPWAAPRNSPNRAAPGERFPMTTSRLDRLGICRVDHDEVEKHKGVDEPCSDVHRSRP